MAKRVLVFFLIFSLSACASDSRKRLQLLGLQPQELDLIEARQRALHSEYRQATGPRGNTTLASNVLKKLNAQYCESVRELGAKAQNEKISTLKLDARTREIWLQGHAARNALEAIEQAEMDPAICTPLKD